MWTGARGEVSLEVDRKAALVLGPGFAPGLAGLGFLWELERRGIEPECAAGANTGALAAAMWALRLDLELAARVLASLPWERFAVARDFGASDPLLGALSVLTRGASFSDLDRRVIVVAKELETGATRLIEEGSVAAALRASMAVPGVFEPISMQGATLVDGGGALPGAAEAVRKRLGGRRAELIEVYVAAPGEPAAGRAGFPLHIERMARYASTTWPKAVERPQAVWIEEEPSGLLDFGEAMKWFQAGRRAAERLVGGAPGRLP